MWEESPGLWCCVRRSDRARQAGHGRGLLGDTEFIVVESRGGGYGPGTRREGWDHAEAWLPHAVSMTGLEPRFIVAELTMAETNPAMAHLAPPARESLERAHAQIDHLWEASQYAA
jgi:FMN-dependent NADH-azoreductase